MALERDYVRPLEIDLKQATSTDIAGKTLLHYASMQGKQRLVSMLLRKGVDVGIRGRDGQFPLHGAAHFGSDEIVGALLSYEEGTVNAFDNCGRTPLHLAASEGHELIVDKLIKSSATLEARTKNGQTPLLIAARNGHEPVVQLLLKAKAKAKVESGSKAKVEADSKDKFGRTPLSFAAENGHEAVVKLLRSITTTSSQS